MVVIQCDILYLHGSQLLFPIKLGYKFFKKKSFKYVSFHVGPMCVI